jgi:hypothetical protein
MEVKFIDQAIPLYGDAGHSIGSGVPVSSTPIDAIAVCVCSSSPSSRTCVFSWLSTSICFRWSSSTGSILTSVESIVSSTNVDFCNAGSVFFFDRVFPGSRGGRPKRVDCFATCLGLVVTGCGKSLSDRVKYKTIISYLCSCQFQLLLLC